MTARKINGYTFCYCTSLKKIEIPDSVTEIGEGAFEGCESLDEVKLPSKIEKISGNTFQNCTSLNKIELPETVKEIGYSAFRGCGSVAQGGHRSQERDLDRRVRVRIFRRMER